MLGLANGILGIALLFAGRKLFWLFIGTLGFITGIQLTTSFWQGPDWLLLVIGLIVGVIFAVLATFLQTLAIGVAGFLIWRICAINSGRHVWLGSRRPIIMGRLHHRRDHWHSFCQFPV